MRQRFVVFNVFSCLVHNLWTTPYFFQGTCFAQLCRLIWNHGALLQPLHYFLTNDLLCSMDSGIQIRKIIFTGKPDKSFERSTCGHFTETKKTFGKKEHLEIFASGSFADICNNPVNEKQKKDVFCTYIFYWEKVRPGAPSLAESQAAGKWF